MHGEMNECMVLPPLRRDWFGTGVEEARRLLSPHRCGVFQASRFICIAVACHGWDVGRRSSDDFLLLSFVSAGLGFSGSIR